MTSVLREDLGQDLAAGGAQEFVRSRLSATRPYYSSGTRATRRQEVTQKDDQVDSLLGLIEGEVLRAHRRRDTQQRPLPSAPRRSRGV